MISVWIVLEIMYKNRFYNQFSIFFSPTPLSLSSGEKKISGTYLLTIPHTYLNTMETHSSLSGPRCPSYNTDFKFGCRSQSNIPGTSSQVPRNGLLPLQSSTAQSFHQGFHNSASTQATLTSHLWSSKARPKRLFKIPYRHSFFFSSPTSISGACLNTLENIIPIWSSVSFVQHRFQVCLKKPIKYPWYFIAGS